MMDVWSQLASISFAPDLLLGFAASECGQVNFFCILPVVALSWLYMIEWTNWSLTQHLDAD
jgi:hypothetical protein